MRQVELARQLGVSRAYITMLIKGQRQPSKKLLRKIEKLTGKCSLPAILLGNGVQVVACSKARVWNRIGRISSSAYDGGYTRLLSGMQLLTSSFVKI